MPAILELATEELPGVRLIAVDTDEAGLVLTQAGQAQ